MLLLREVADRRYDLVLVGPGPSPAAAASRAGGDLAGPCDRAGRGPIADRMISAVRMLLRPAVRAYQLDAAPGDRQRTAVSSRAAATTRSRPCAPTGAARGTRARRAGRVLRCNPWIAGRLRPGAAALAPPRCGASHRTDPLMDQKRLFPCDRVSACPRSCSAVSVPCCPSWCRRPAHVANATATARPRPPRAGADGRVRDHRGHVPPMPVQRAGGAARKCRA